MIGVQALLMGGKGATRVSKTPELNKKESIGSAKTFRFNSGSISPKAQTIAGYFTHAHASNMYQGTLRPGDVVNKVIINSGIIFADILTVYEEKVIKKLQASHIGRNSCVKKANSLFYTKGLANFCADCTSGQCPVNVAMIQEGYLRC